MLKIEIDNHANAVPVRIPIDGFIHFVIHFIFLLDSVMCLFDKEKISVSQEKECWDIIDDDDSFVKASQDRTEYTLGFPALECNWKIEDTYPCGSLGRIKFDEHGDVESCQDSRDGSHGCYNMNLI